MKHYMKLVNDRFKAISEGYKTIEMRLYDEKRKLINIGDIIEFTNKDTGEVLDTKVIDIHLFDTFEELYNHFDKVSLGYKLDEDASFKDMERYYSIDEQKNYGVVAIKISKL